MTEKDLAIVKEYQKAMLDAHHTILTLAKSHDALEKAMQHIFRNPELAVKYKSVEAYRESKDWARANKDPLIFREN